MSSVLIIDNDKKIGDAIAVIIRELGHEAHIASGFIEGLEAFRRNEYALVLLEVQLPDGSGLKLLPKLRETLPCPEVIIMTGDGDKDGAERAIRNGAWDYLPKPVEVENISTMLTRVLQYQTEKGKRAVPGLLKRDRIIGNSPRVNECLEQVALAASSNGNVLILGETGTGKELFAAAIHDNSIRANHNFVVVDCSALPETLVENLLFGHEKGAYTGADRNQPGLVAQADGGTLFLDEIGELPLNIQRAFLRVIQERCYRPVGGKKEIHSNFCLVAATNRNLDEMVQKGQFRDDLLHRLKTIQISLPPLRKHKQDIRALTQHYVRQFCLNHHVQVKELTPEFCGALEKYDWPGNVRELNQALERAIASIGAGPLLYPKDLPIEIRAQMARNSVPPATSGNATQNSMKDDNQFPHWEEVRAAAVIDAERTYLKTIMNHVEGNVASAISLSGLSRARFYALLKKHEMTSTIQSQ
jgi:two-component system, NtrC family, response regulator